MLTLRPSGDTLNEVGLPVRLNGRRGDNGEGSWPRGPQSAGFFVAESDASGKIDQPQAAESSGERPAKDLESGAEAPQDQAG